jgi:hypothetical protein
LLEAEFGREVSLVAEDGEVIGEPAEYCGHDEAMGLVCGIDESSGVHEDGTWTPATMGREA